ncbi:MAG: LysR family transcriptional regulator [Bacillota bacterium]|uniref:LysR family transcriptional regulator n=1 Tax=Virgibacillus salarius TaxID=447199 RepID=A0A941DTP6_9BACI|nr:MULTISPECIES: LysR family transcriptional regulator [Bacillaceae]NAZ07907.1 LysR family transcriptional regulator [Agaribacter marinus]MBR7795191.1 LysR family transcriptional regulator [Virgibacillus salarius]MCC2249396.1 LysR family transcriptional regulator [Virgibacillus sp. AGTR]MDY7043011.1 LysR family transcriptional regulator [Virgibacillus sp. M23]QRZ18811.1 LysR family transcriptional regulator [Virgibacillus sp. AGTR]
MYYDALRTYVALVEERNFTKTAEKLHISQPSVSLHIKNLEKEFGTELIIRSPKSMQISPTGEVLYHRAKQILTIYEQTKQDIMEHHQTIKGNLKIGASFTIGEYIIPDLLVELQDKYPELTLEVVIGNTEEIVQRVRLFQVDIGLIEGQTNDKELSVYPFMQDELYVLAATNHPLAKKATITMKELHNQAWVTREEGSGTREYLNHVIRSNGVKAKSILTISSNQGVKESVIKGMGLSLLSHSVIERDVQQNQLAILRLNNTTFNRTFSYVYSPIMKSKKNVEAFIEALKQKWPYT